MIKQLRQHIQNALRQVNLENAPKVFEALQNEQGYKNIEDRIIKMMIAESMRASACIIHVENEL